MKPPALDPVARVGVRVRREPALGILVLAAIVWAAWMYLHVWRRHDRFGTFDNDLGFHSHYVWLLAHGRAFSTVLGLPVLGHNATLPGYLLFVPFAWLGWGPHFLNLVQTVVIAGGAIPLYVLARRRLDSEWQALAIGGAWLLMPIVQGNVWETFHPEAIAMLPLLCAYVAADSGRWRRFALAVALALLWKNDVTLFVTMLGLLLVVTGWRARDRARQRAGLVTVAVAGTWFAIWMVTIPHFAGGGTVFGPLYGELGDTPTEVARTAVVDPARVGERLKENDPVGYTRDLMAPLGFVPLLSPQTLAIAAPQVAVNLLSEQGFTHDPFDNPHYQALPAVAMALATVEGLGWLRRRRPQLVTFAVGLVGAAALAASMAWGPLPMGVRRAHYWSADGDPTRDAKLAALELVGEDDGIVAHYLLVPHLVDRPVIYSYPNPWQQVFYGIEGTPPPDVSGVRWVVQDTNLFDPATDPVWQCLQSSGAFTTAFDQDGIVVLRRVGGGDEACQTWA